MTNNHLLLYRLAELMFEQEQHVLPVDLLFNDTKIGDFVRSIQIDSPYQQMLIESALTEMVRDGKLYVSFTVERYFHFVLGEVIYNRTVGLSAKALKIILEEKKLNGLKEGVEQCLMLDVLENDLTRLMWLIDEVDVEINICVNPILQAIKSNGPQKIIDKLFENNINNKWLILLLLDEKLNDLQLNSLRKHFLFEILKKNPLKLRDEILLGLRAINELDIEIAEEYYKKFDFNNANFYDSEECLIYLGKFEFKYSNYIKSIDYFKKAREILSNNIDVDIIKIARIYNLIALSWNKFGNYKEALNNQKKSLSLIIKNLGDNHIKVAVAYNNLGAIYSKINKYDDALKSYQKSLEIKYLNLGRYHIDVATSYNNIAYINSKQKDYEASLKYYKKSLTIKLKNLGENSQVVALSYNNISSILQKLKMFDEALVYVRKGLKIRTEVLGSKHRDVAASYNTLGGLYSKIGEFDKALLFYEKALSIRLNSLNKSNPVVAISYKNIGSILEKLGKFESAIKYYEMSLNVKKILFGTKHNEVEELLIKINTLRNEN